MNDKEGIAMKRIIIFILFVVLMSYSCLPCFALKENTPNKELDDLFKKVYDFFVSTQIDPPYSDNIPFQPYKNGTYQYVTVDESRLLGGSLNGMKEYANILFTEDIVDQTYKFNRYEGLYKKEYIHNLPLYEETEEGIKWFPLTGGVYYFQYYFYAPTDDVIFDSLDIEGNIVTGKVLMWINESEFMYWLPIKFVKSNQGWQLGDCELFRWMWDPSSINIDLYLIQDKETFEKYNPFFEYDSSFFPNAPSTGDVSGERVAVIGVVSLACIIPTACLMRRRRRASAE